ncbi:MAG: mycothiol synthase [Acidimicrobiales bacterium]|jgi:mycothiol synthase
MSNHWHSATSLTPDQRLDVLNLLNRTESQIGREAIDEVHRRAVVHGWPAEHWLRHRDNNLVGYALLSGSEHPTIEMCGGGFDEDLLEAVLSSHHRVDWWERDVDHVATAAVIRTLQMLRVNLPVPVFEVPDGAVLRIFEAMHDEDSWLDQNNAAFAHHPEQGAWLREDLAERTNEPWFDPSGFLLLEIDGRLAASCWTKVHELHPDRFGEIYVVSVHPDFQGRNLGRVMVTQGLASLRKKGVSSAVLFVDQTNAVAKKLYESIGFWVGREDHLVRFVRPS